MLLKSLLFVYLFFLGLDENCTCRLSLLTQRRGWRLSPFVSTITTWYGTISLSLWESGVGPFPTDTPSLTLCIREEVLPFILVFVLSLLMGDECNTFVKEAKHSASFEFKLPPKKIRPSNDFLSKRQSELQRYLEELIDFYQNKYPIRLCDFLHFYKYEPNGLVHQLNNLLDKALILKIAFIQSSHNFFGTDMFCPDRRGFNNFIFYSC